MNWSLPLYQSAAPRDFSHFSGNYGLRYMKFADAWDQPGANVVVFNDIELRKGRNQPDWLMQFDHRSVGDGAELNEAAQRLFQLIEKAGGKVLGLRNPHARFVSGLGLQHPTENGFAWHHTLGVPYLPASGLKGVLRGYLHDYDQGSVGFDAQSVLGTPDAVGDFIFTDLLPIKPVRLVVEVLTPHYAPYYQSTGDNVVAPGDWHSPVPIEFLAVDDDQSWICGVIPRRKPSRDFDQVCKSLQDALAITGAGAKTSIGFGYFELDKSLTDHIETEVRKQCERDAQAAQRAAGLANADPQVRQLTELSEKWRPDDPQKYKDIDEFLNSLGDGSLTTAAAEWLIENYLETRPQDKGLWKNPDRTKGKKKQLYYNERRVGIAKRMKELLEPNSPLLDDSSR